MAMRRVAGLISGTSMDGLDMAIVDVEIGRPSSFAFMGGQTAPFPHALQARLRDAYRADPGTLTRLDDDLGRFLVRALSEFVHGHDAEIDLIGSHGQTVFHEHGRATLQIGEPGHLALTFGCPVVSDFRRADIAAGGCGAPLAPILDKWALSADEHAVLALNLGGIANFSALPSRGQREEAVIAFDTGPANMVMDILARRFTKGQQEADIEGTFSSRGEVREAWLQSLLGDPYFALAPPKSCGDAEFGEAFVDHWLGRFPPDHDQDWYDLLATAAELSATTIYQAYERFVVAERPVGIVVASGGGIRNPELMRRLGRRFDPIAVATSADFGLDPDFKEAIAFALMASARVDGIPANLPEVTGAGRAVLLGKVTELLPRPAALTKE